MTKLEAAEKATAGKGKKSKGANMRDAVDSTEQIRQWEDHMWELPKLEETLKTTKENGQTSA